MAGNVLLDGVLLSAHLEVHVHEPERGANGAPRLYGTAYLLFTYHIRSPSYSTTRLV